MGSRRCSMFRGATRVGIVAAMAAVVLVAIQAANRRANQAAGAAAVVTPTTTTAGILTTAPPVGGISINADGLLGKATVDALGNAARRWPRDWRRPPRT